MTIRRTFRLPGMLLVAAGIAAMTGCDSAVNEPAVGPTATPVRAARRLYDGAPPVIPHAPLNIKCVACHTDTGKEAPPLGFAPANPHAHTDGLSSTSNCQQCHVFVRRDGAFAESDFRGLKQQIAKAKALIISYERLFEDEESEPITPSQFEESDIFKTIKKLTGNKNLFPALNSQ